MKKIGLTGNIGSGKSSVAQHFMAAGLKVVDLDRIGRDKTNSDPILQEKLAKLSGLKRFERAPFRKIFFADEKIRKKAEAILHPEIYRELERELQSMRDDEVPLVIIEAALLLETDFRNLDGLVLVTAEPSLRLKRTLKRDGMTRELFEAIEQTQLDPSQSKKRATWILQNDLTPNDLEKAIEKLLEDWKKLGWLR